jgi:ferredoxin-type protein NapH
LIRRIVQTIAFFIGNSYFASIPRASFYQGNLKGACVPVLNCYACPLAWGSCPIGTMQHFIIVRALPFYLIGVLGLIGLVVGRWPCGWLCPFGFFQELLHRIPLRKIKLPDWLRHLKFVFLVGVVGLVAWWTFEPWFCKLCPAGTLEAGLPWLAWKARGSVFSEGMDFTTWMFGVKMVILVGFILLSAMVWRPFCRFMCPLGAFLGLMNKVSLLQLDYDLDNCAIAYAKGSDFENCASCKHCSNHCPMGLKVPEQRSSVDCIRCMNCTSYGSVHWRFGFAPPGDRTGETARARPEGGADEPPDKVPA